MPNYSEGKLYKIECLTTGLIYVGSTTEKYLCKRLVRHTIDYRRYLKGNYAFTRSFLILENNNYRIELIEEVNCETKDQLHKREGHYIRTLDCVNKRMEGRTLDEQKEAQKEYLSRYNESHKEERKQRDSVKCHCPCGSEVRHGDKSQHAKSKKHQAYLETLNN